MSGEIDIHHLAAAYALDALDQRERAAFEAHYPSCEVCRADVVGFRETLAELSVLSAALPPADLKARVLAEIAQTRQLSPRLPGGVHDLAGPRRGRVRAFAALVVVAAAVAAFVVGTLVTRTGGASTYAEALAEVMRQNDAHMMTLAPRGATGTVKVAWSQGRGRVVLMGEDMPAAPTGSAYELWMIEADGPHPMRVLQAANDGELKAVIDMSGDPMAWGVTMEPKSGSDKPTGSVIFLATV